MSAPRPEELTLRAALREIVRCVRGGDETAGFAMDDALLDTDESIEQSEVADGAR